ncbi:GntR family transcriptional regulator [Desulfosarcina alkanivorans]|uniref:GntR family transcriptional regulator n=1 Tax=Desulfosarcina alkanivorans TaxID=571177 RepID=A0A5K7YK82_9BACT|nr:GntR family transcriptional regulator [Desulfosarcina alkanivorans]BBO68560.1 GntR family transcriptional regulator [Desulfosarcina alkanivorans]
MFNPVNGSGMTGNVALQIEAAILDGKLSPGEKIPSERELQTLFKTGRGVVREALRELKQKGLIETRRGGQGGTYVKKIGAYEASQPLTLMIKQRDIDIADLIEFRESIDRTVTILAISRGDDDQAAALLRGVEKLETAGLCPSPSMARITEVDRELNLLLVKMTRNPLFDWIMQTIQISFGSYDYVLYEDAYYREKTIQNWRETATAIAAREPLEALSFIGFHYVLLNRCIRENKKDSDA